MRITRQATLIAAIFSLVACNAHEPTAVPPVVSTSPRMQLTGELGAYVVRGQVTTPSGAQQRILTVNAVQSASGQVTGGYRVEFSATGLFFDVTASCLSIVGNTAWVAGHITASNIPVVNIGSVAYFYVTDNGKPHPVDAVPPDVMSTSKFNDPLGEDIVFCTERPQVLPILAGLQGDIDIR